MKDHAGAEADFDRALALKPGRATLSVLYNNRGVIRVGRQETRAQGIEDLKRAVAHHPAGYEAHASLAEAYRLDKQPAKASAHMADAVAAARRQLEAGERKPAALVHLLHHQALLRLRRGDRQGAEADLVEAARLAGGDRPLRARMEEERGWVLHLQGRSPEPVAGYEAAGSEECIELAKVALLRRLYRHAARLYAEGFAAKPALAADPRSGHRYDAARAAVQAAFGEGMDGGAPSEEDRSELLGQARGWLCADLAAWSKQAEADKAASPHLREALGRWRQAPALANVRDKESLAKLPAAERAAWRKLWADVDDALKHPAAKP
jgi:hypothetical protein